MEPQNQQPDKSLKTTPVGRPGSTIAVHAAPGVARILLRLASMSAFKQMPNQKLMRVLRYAVWVVIIGLALALHYLEKHGEPAASPLFIILAATTVGMAIFGIFMGRLQRCPDCAKLMREVYEDFHPKARDTHVLFCERCDVVWDTTVPKSNG